MWTRASRARRPMCDVSTSKSARARDIAFLGGLINYVLTHERWFKEYVLAYTNASVHRGRRSSRTPKTWTACSAATTPRRATTTRRRPLELQAAGGRGRRRRRGHAGQDVGKPVKRRCTATASRAGPARTPRRRGTSTEIKAGEIQRDQTLQDPNCVMQLLRRHFARYTPEMCAEICGCTPEQIVQVAEMLCDNSGRERTSAICYAVGWTQHTTGVQIIRAASILQLLLGNMGRPGGGIMALRGHASIQGSTDIPTLYDLLPGYLPQPTADETPRHAGLVCQVRGPADRLLGQLQEVHRQPAQSLLRRGGDDGERLLLQLAAAPGRRLLHDPGLPAHGEGRLDRLLPVRAEPGGRVGQRQSRPRRACGTWTGWSSPTGSRPKAPSSGRTTRPARRRRRSRPKSSSSRPPRRRKKKGR